MKKIYSLLIAFACASFMMANATTYTVVGSSDAIFGTSWSPENAANDMVADGDVFKLVKEGIELPVGDIEYKIVEEHSWAKSYPQSGNAKFNIAKSGKYDITFVLDLAKSPEYSAVAELKEEVVIDPTVSLKGSWDSWAAEVKFQLAADKKSAVAKKELDPATYEFKAIINGSDWRSNGGSINRENPKADGIDGNNDANMKLVADAKGEYAFTWIFESNTLEVEFPEKGDDPIVPPVEEVQFYVTGETLVGSWEPNAWPVTEDYVEFFLQPGKYAFKITVDGTWNTAKGFESLSGRVDGLSADADGNICFELKEEGTVFIYFTGEAIAVDGNFFVDDPIVPPVSDEHHFLKNNWANGEWEWKEMVEDEGSWVLAEVVIGDGGGVNFATEISNDAPWIEYKNIPAWLQTGEETLLEALDTVVFIFDPEEVNAYDPDKGHGLFAWVLAKHQSGGDTPEPPVVDESFFLKNNWNGGEAWTWEAMSKDEADGLWKLEHVFGGTGVNLNSKAEEEGAEWFPLEKIAGDEIQALDTVRFIYDSKEKVLSAVLLGRPAGGEDPIVPPVVDEAFFLKNNWNGGEAWTWEAMSKDEADGLWKLEHVFGGTGVNLNTKAEEEGAEWFPLDKIAGDEIQALDTVRFIYDSKEKVLSAVLLGRPSGAPEPPVVEEHHFLKNNWDNGEWAWKEMVEDEGSWILAEVVIGDGGGVNFATAISDDAPWIEYKNIPAWLQTGEETLLEALDTVVFIFDPEEVNAYDPDKGHGLFAWVLAKHQSGGDTPEPPVVDEHHFMKNNWANGEWEWKEMIQADEDTWSLAEVVIGDGGGVNFATAISDDAPWIEYKNIQAWLLNGDEAQLEALDTVTFIFTPSEVNAYDRERGHGLFAIILAKHAGAPEPPVSDEHHFLKNNWANGEWAWKEMVQKDEDTWLLQNVVIGDGGGVNFATEISDDAPWIEYKNISAWLMNGEEAQLEALDTVIFVFTPSEVNAYDPEKGHGLFAMIVGKHGAAPIEPEIPNGFYIVGSFNNWTPSAEYALLPNPNAPEGVEEYMVSTVLQEGDELKGLAVYNGMYFYYPDGDNIVVPAEYAGKCTLYFRPAGNDEWPWKFIYIVVEQEQGLNTINASDKAVKMMQNGQLFIQKNGKTYNVLGTLVK